MNNRTSMSSFRGFFRTLALLLKTANRRSTGRTAHQQKLLNHRTSTPSEGMMILGFIAMLFIMAVMHGLAAFTISRTAQEARRYEVERDGTLVVSDRFYKDLEKFKEADPILEQPDMLGKNDRWLKREAEKRQEDFGGNVKDLLAFYKQAVQQRPLPAFVPRSEIKTSLGNLNTSDKFAVTIGSLIFLWWLLMLVCQGEGLELDIHRRRNPMWEWLLTHPVHPGAVFLAEMLSPIAANPAYLSAPLFPAILFGITYGAPYGVIALPLIGIPTTIAAACLGKSIEIAVMLRGRVRSRGAVIGLMSWIGYVAFISFLFGAYITPRIINLLGTLLFSLTQKISLPLILPILGKTGTVSSFWLGALICWLIALALTGIAVLLSIWGTQKGLAGNGAPSTPASPRRSEKFITWIGKDPLYKKELLWFLRDRSALIQVFLIPITIASVQLFNLRHLVQHAGNAWHTLSGTAIIFGTYFLWILGPRSLTSEGSALWIAQTWPRGMEDLLKAKARLWFLISTLVVGAILVFAAVRFPSELWKIALIGVGWTAFGRSMSEKCVTLVTVTKESGETEKIPTGRRMAAALGMLSFGIGVLTRQWQLATLGIVYSWITAAAMWQNFRARLPYLYDPWEEKVPPPPTVMHAMIAISVLVEFGAIFSGIFIAALGESHLGTARMIAYALISCIVMFITIVMMSDRNLSLKQTWTWCENRVLKKTIFLACTTGILVGITGGFAAKGYISLLSHFETVREMLRTSQEFLDSHSGMRTSLFCMAVFIAPFSEEYLFRGLLFRALDREWGGWKALLGSAAFFAIYHPPISWLPVGLLGLFSAWIFKKTGTLTPCVLLHMAYNATVLSL